MLPSCGGLATELRELRAEVEVLRAKNAELLAAEHFRQLRTNAWPGLGIQCLKVDYPKVRCNYLPDAVVWAMSMDGKALFNGQPQSAPVVKRYESEHMTMHQMQPKVRPYFKVNGSRPIWSHKLWSAYQSIIGRGKSVSPMAYPHAAEDISLAIKHFIGPIKHLSIGVISSITPWVEVTLKELGATSITTVDYNKPFLERKLRAMGLSVMAWHDLSGVYASGRRFDLLVSFSGIEHDGLGRYGDPVNPYGDLAAMRELRALLAVRGKLLLGIPVANQDDIYYPNHRIYGPVRLPWLLKESGLSLGGRVWNGRVVEGGLGRAADAPPLYRRRWCANERKLKRLSSGTKANVFACNTTNDGPNLLGDYQHQPVLVLERLRDTPVPVAP